MSDTTLSTLAQRLQTKGGVDQAIRTLTDAARSITAIVMDDEPKAALLSQVERQREVLTELQRQLRTGETIVLDPDLSGWRYVTCWIDDERPRGQQERVAGHTSLNSVIRLAQEKKLPVVIGSEPVEEWRENVARRLRKAGVIAITEMED